MRYPPAVFEEYRKSSTWRRIGVLLAVLLAFMLAPALVSLIRDPFVERVPPAGPHMIDIDEPARFRLIDRDDDGRIDCALKVPATSWTRLGYAREGARRCDGRRVSPMPDELAALADEDLALRTRHGFSTARPVDLDDDDRVDCLLYDGTWRYAEGASCPDRRTDARQLDETERAAADRVLEIEHEISTRWLAPLLDD